MFLRRCLPLLAFILVHCTAYELGAAAAPASGDRPEDEAQRLYDRANDYVTTITEGQYSYSYQQFYWKRASTNLEWIATVYPDTPIGRRLKAGELTIGPFTVPYFQERVLFWLEEKRKATIDPITCAIYLCELKGETWDAPRTTAVMGIIEALSRQQRWGEALKFPVLPQDEADKQLVIFRVAARFEQDNLVKELLAVTPTDQLPRFHAVQGEALALRGQPRQKIAELLARDPSDQVKLGVLSGMARREALLRLAADRKIPVEKIVLAGAPLKFPEVRDDVEAVARSLFPTGNRAADEILATYRAALGERPVATATVPVHTAYMEYLAAMDRLTDLSTYPATPGLTDAVRNGCELKLIELLAHAGRSAESEKIRTNVAAARPADADATVLSEFRGRMSSEVKPLVVHQFTLSELPFKDPAYAAQALMEWSLTPNRSIRGAGPYDAVVAKFNPGFENLPEPKSKEAVEAARVQKGY
jgi:hypothetical protein